MPQFSLQYLSEFSWSEYTCSSNLSFLRERAAHHASRERQHRSDASSPAMILIVDRESNAVIEKIDL